MIHYAERVSGHMSFNILQLYLKLVLTNNRGHYTAFGRARHQIRHPDTSRQQPSPELETTRKFTLKMHAKLRYFLAFRYDE